MRRRTFLALLGSSSFAGSLMLGSSAFTEETATRQTSVAVVGDSDAYLTLEFPQHPVSFDCSTEVDVTVRNRTGQPLDELTVLFTLGAGSIADLSVSGPGKYTKPSGSKVSLGSGTLAPGQATTVTAELDSFAGQRRTDLVFNVEASGGSVVIKTTSKRVIDLHYECSEEEGEGDDGDEDEDEDEGNNDEGKGDDGGEDGDDDEDKDNNEGNDDDDDKGGDSDDDSGDGDSED